MVQRSRRPANNGIMLSVIEQAFTNQDPSVKSPLIHNKSNQSIELSSHSKFNHDQYSFRKMSTIRDSNQDKDLKITLNKIGSNQKNSFHGKKKRSSIRKSRSHNYLLQLINDDEDDKKCTLSNFTKNQNINMTSILNNIQIKDTK